MLRIGITKKGVREGKNKRCATSQRERFDGTIASPTLASAHDISILVERGISFGGTFSVPAFKT